MDLIPFNRPHFTGKEAGYIRDALEKGKLSANGKYTKLCQEFLEKRYGFKKSFLTNSCTQALEMAALLMEIGPGDEIIMPSYTFVSTANAFALRGCTIVFADSRPDFPGIDENKVEALISNRTRGIVVVHYAGIACQMEEIMALSNKYNLFLVEDAAAALDSKYKFMDGREQALGTFGHFATFSFHETKNISTGEGGMLVVNDERFFYKAQVVWQKGTNRDAYFSGKVSHYQWVSLGGAFGPSEIMAACLWAQLQELDTIQNRRKQIWNWYDQNFPQLLDGFELEWIKVPDFALVNFHMFYGVAKNASERDRLIAYLEEKGIMAVFHYQCLHQSPFYMERNVVEPLTQAEIYSRSLVRFPLFADLEIEKLANLIAG